MQEQADLPLVDKVYMVDKRELQSCPLVSVISRNDLTISKFKIVVKGKTS